MAEEMREINLSREEQRRIIGIVAELRERTDRESLQTRFLYRTQPCGITRKHIADWCGEMIEKLEEMKRLADEELS